ncbi:hypothetical protein ACI4AF_29355, partial [Klebsiella pneumoniae]|uniref:hypothetical protein n=1 Tax=Klebsiella pneumoniae TaxID=573 RepID=UPI0038536564
AAVAVALLAALPLLRWTLCLPGLATLAWILYRGLGWSRLRIAGALVLNVFALGLYQTYFLERFVPVLSGHHDPGLLVSLYLLNI